FAAGPMTEEFGHVLREFSFPPKRALDNVGDVLLHAPRLVGITARHGPGPGVGVDAMGEAGQERDAAAGDTTRSGAGTAHKGKSWIGRCIGQLLPKFTGAMPKLHGGVPDTRLA